MSFEHTEKFSHKPSKRTERQCMYCNTVKKDGTIEEIGEDGRSIKKKVSLNRARNWEVIDDKDAEVTVETRYTADYVYQGKNKKGKGVQVNEEGKDNSKEARKAKRQERAKNSKNSRSGHAKESMKHSNKVEEESTTTSSSGDSDDESSEEEFKKQQFRVETDTLGKTEKAYITHYTCRCGHFNNIHSSNSDLKQMKREEFYQEARQENDFKLAKKYY